MHDMRDHESCLMEDLCCQDWGYILKELDRPGKLDAAKALTEGTRIK